MEWHVWFVVLSPPVLALCYYHYWEPRRRLCSLAREIPGPKLLPIIGNGALFWGTLGETFDVVSQLNATYGPVVRVWLGNKLIVLLSSPEDIETILGDTRNVNKEVIMTNAARFVLGGGLLTSRGDLWRNHRKLIAPMFHAKILASYVEVFGEKSGILVAKLEDLADGRSVDIYDVISLCSLDAICETAIGCAVNTQKCGHSKFRDAIATFRELGTNRLLKPWLLSDWIYPWTSDGKRAASTQETVKNFSQQIIKKKLADHSQGICTSATNLTTASGKTLTSFLDLIVQASESEASALSFSEIQDEITTMALAGLETSATAMSLTLILLGIHPDVQDRVHEELVGIFGEDDERPASSDDMMLMEALERVIKEALRLFPIGAFLSREITEETVLPSGYVLPEGCSIFVFPYAVHRQSELYPEPCKFRPDRWLAEKVSDRPRNPYGQLSFGAGPRTCVGKKYAMWQMKSLLSAVLRRFHVRTALVMEDLEQLDLSITLSLTGMKYDIQLERRRR